MGYPYSQLSAIYIPNLPIFMHFNTILIFGNNKMIDFDLLRIKKGPYLKIAVHSAINMY